jgi:hypothetical protein
MPALAQRTGAGLYLPPPNDPFYLANAPTVLFAALFLLGLAGATLYNRVTVRRVPLVVVLVSLALIPLLSMALITQRASIGITILAVSFLLIIAFWRRPGQATVPGLLLALLLWTGWDVVSLIMQDAAHKTAIVGLNMRWAEAAAVAEHLGATPLTVLSGGGWGAMVASPAAGGATVNFTHSLITTYWLKAGLPGLALALIYLWHMGFMLLQALRRYPVLAVALAGPFLIDIFLYASFKSLDFGLILLLVTLWADRAERLHKTPAYSMQEQSI